MYQKVLRIILAIENNLIFASVKKGFLMTFPLVLIGSIALLIRSFPLGFITNFLTGWAGGILDQLLLCIFDSTIGFISVYLVLTISYNYASRSKANSPILRIMAMITSLICFVCSFGAESGSLTITCLGPLGIFTAIFSSIISTHIFLYLCNRKQSSVHIYSMGADDNYKASLLAILPLIICIFIFTGTNQIISMIFHVNNFNELIALGLNSLFYCAQNEPGNGLFYTFLLNIFWVFGIHGSNALTHVSNTMFVPAITNPEVIVSKSFMDVFAQIGGSGTTFCLVIALLIVSRSSNNRRLAKTAAPLVLFNINELLVFGFPIVLNPIMIFPFVLVPICSYLIAYISTITGLIPITTTVIGWTVPIGFSGYLATNSIIGALVQVAIVITGTLIYIPFIRLWEKIQFDSQDERLTDLISQFRKDERTNPLPTLLDRQDKLGQMARTIVIHFKNELNQHKVNMHYQPQVNEFDHVVGAEALLRFSYNGRPVYPPLAVALAREDNFLDILTWTILETVCNELSDIKLQTKNDIHISVNIVAEQLDNIDFIKRVIELVKTHDAYNNICLELTEETSLLELSHIQENIALLGQNGITVAIDDFGMGQTSLSYLKSNNFEYVKLDGELVRNIAQNPRCSQIITSIVQLGNSLGYKVIAEYVENVEIRDILLGIGCKLYQGYYYSPAIQKDKFIDYCKSRL